ncbi:MAG: periplasmic heavy metal sensor [Pseudomonadota bacterium]|uniref:periplasmic heavy metal sensor n=1 Tax=Phenylobacterium sp. TaxID=1871053 RepID=UPI0025E29AB9|nr:periplasmic heavy metal sensor [Phenylobacterium sp.]MBT9473215.1 periplasmic heavy metal sensor [Phenylobacterium sp.]
MKGLRGLLLTLVLVALAAGLGAWGGAKYVLRAEREPSLHSFLHGKLNLSTDQKAKLEILETEFAVRRRAREAELRLANAELAAAIETQHRYSPEVKSAIEHFHDVMGELQKETIVHILDMRAILTPNQAAIFDKRVSEALTEETK